MNPRSLSCLLGCLALVWLQGAPAAEPRIALVIGNGSYPFARLGNPVNDAADMAASLRAAGFDVMLETDADRQGMQAAIRSFGSTLKQKGGVGLFFFAGHGAQVSGENYLVPIVDGIGGEEDLKRRSVSVAEAVEAMAAARNELNIVILDACRDNPVSSRTTHGLSRVDSNASLFVSFSTSPGSVALDGEGRNSPYTKHLASAISIPDLSIEQTFKRTLKGVYQETHGQQTPWISSSFFGDFSFRRTSRVTTAARPVAPSAAEPGTSPRMAAATPLASAGIYRAAGVNPNGSRYRGMATVRRAGSDYQLRWWIGRQIFSGSGHLAGRMLVVDWGQTSPVVYGFGTGRRLDGEWADGSASEQLDLFAAAADGPVAVPGGRYKVTGRNPNGSSYSGSVLIANQGSRLALEWKVGSSYRGTGALAGNLLTVDWGSATPVVYALAADGSLRGLWDAGAGEEILVPER